MVVNVTSPLNSLGELVGSAILFCSRPTLRLASGQEWMKARVPSLPCAQMTTKPLSSSCIIQKRLCCNSHRKHTAPAFSVTRVLHLPAHNKVDVLSLCLGINSFLKKRIAHLTSTPSSTRYLRAFAYRRCCGVCSRLRVAGRCAAGTAC